MKRRISLGKKKQQLNEQRKWRAEVFWGEVGSFFGGGSKENLEYLSRVLSNSFI